MKKLTFGIILVTTLGFMSCQPEAEDPESEEHVQEIDSIRNEIEAAGDSIEKKTDNLESSIDDID